MATTTNNTFSLLGFTGRTISETIMADTDQTNAVDNKVASIILNRWANNINKHIGQNGETIEISAIVVLENGNVAAVVKGDKIQTLNAIVTSDDPTKLQLTDNDIGCGVFNEERIVLHTALIREDIEDCVMVYNANIDSAIDIGCPVDSDRRIVRFYTIA